MAELKTKATGADVAQFLAAITDAQRRRDCETLAGLMQKAAGAAPKMWGPSIVGFGHYHYVYESGREGDWFQVGFASRKKDLTLYLTGGVERHAALFEKLGPHKTGKGCLYLKRLADVHLPTLRKLITLSVQAARAAHRP